MFDSLTKAIFIKFSIPKLSTMITSNSHNATIFFSLQLCAQIVKHIKNVRFFSNKFHPCESWQVINDDNQLFIIFSVIFITCWSSRGNLSSKKAGKLKKMQRFKTCHDLLKTCHDSTKQNELFRHWGKRVTMAKMSHDLVKP